MIKKMFLCLALFSASAFCYGEHYIVPTKYDDQEEILDHGGVILNSSKINDVLMYQTQETIKRNRANFFFSISNFSGQKINLYTQNVRVTDQFGRPIRIVPKRELIKNKRRDTNWQLFTSGMVGCLESGEADQAGKTTYERNTRTTALTRYHTRGRINESVDTNVCSTTYGSVHNEAERQRALRAARQDAFNRDQAILRRQACFEEGMQSNYFDAETIYPGEGFSANLQIEIPKEILKDLEFILFHFDLEEEQHTFAFYAGEIRD